MWTKRTALTLVELLVSMAIVGVLIALLLPAIQSSREAARRTECASHLRQFGLALLNFESSHGHLPAGVEMDATHTVALASGHTKLLPYFEQTSLHDLWDRSLGFLQQSPAVLATTVPVFVCPSNSKENPLVWSVLAGLGLPTQYGATDYAFSKGFNDTWCLTIDRLPKDRRGCFYPLVTVRLRDISDGTSKTFAMGEAAGGLRWPLCRGAGCTDPQDGGKHPATNAWSIGAVGNTVYQSVGLYTAGVWGTTVEPLNKWPVTDSWSDIAAQSDCRASDQAGTHSTSNFRSDHIGGAQFLHADGSVIFVDEAIELNVYRAHSTITGGERAEIP